MKAWEATCPLKDLLKIERRETGLSLIPGTFWNLLLSSPVLRLWFLTECTSILARRQTLQRGSPPHQNQSQNCTCAWLALRWRYCLRKAFRGSIAEAHHQTRQRIYKLWPQNQPRENQCECHVSHAPEIKISDHTLVVVDEFTYLGSTISMNSGLDSEAPEESANTPAGMSKLTNRAWENIYLTEIIKKHIYQACVLGTLVYSSETWTTYMRQEHR